ncbi:MAG TPA: F0F1 ATP synthase subunit alpha [Firmicutes bacterium]|nr:F0F1 ATP synthase subunit alpha [Bacillota bacterium]
MIEKARSFEEVFKRQGKPRRVTVTLAAPPGARLRQEIINKLRSITLSPSLGVTFKIDPEIIGGMIIHAGNKIIDGSIRRRFISFQDALTKRMEVVMAGREPSPREIMDVMGAVLESYQPDVGLDSVGEAVSVGDGVARVTDLEDIMCGELVEFERGVPGIALDLDEDSVGCILLGPSEMVREGDTVRALGRVVEVPVGRELLGRVVDALGRPLDGKGPILATRRRPVESPAPGVADREPVRKPLYTGLKVIDALVPIGRGQRELIIGDRQTGKTTIAVDTILNQKDSGVICIYVAIGQKASTVAQVVNTLEQHGAMSYTIVVAATSSDPTPLQYVAPYAGCAMAEEFMYSGEDVLIVYDDLSKHAVAYREMSLLLRRPPGREAYPGDIFYLHGRLLERAAKLAGRLGGGSMTALPIVETLAGDVSAYIPTNIISITDGQIFLEGDLFFAGVRPAVNAGLSVSRVGGDAQIPAMKEVGTRLRLELAQYRELAAFAQFGAELDSTARAQLAQGERIVALLKQKQHSPMRVEDQVVLLHAIANHGLDDVPVDGIAWFEREFISFMREHFPAVLRKIRETGTLPDDYKGSLMAGLEQFKKDFLMGDRPWNSSGK